MSTPDTVNFSFVRPGETVYVYARYVPAAVYNANVAPISDNAFPRVFPPAVDTTVRTRR